MDKSFFEQIGGTYRQEGDYSLPNLTVLESVSAGIWGQRRRQYLREHRKALYNALLLSGRYVFSACGSDSESGKHYRTT